MVGGKAAADRLLKCENLRGGYERNHEIDIGRVLHGRKDNLVYPRCDPVIARRDREQAASVALASDLFQ